MSLHIRSSFLFSICKHSLSPGLTLFKPGIKSSSFKINRNLFTTKFRNGLSFIKIKGGDIYVKQKRNCISEIFKSESIKF